MRTLVTLAMCATTTGCVINSDKYQRPRQLEQAWSVTKPRLLAVRSEPAEPRPGDTVTFDALVADPTGEIDSVLWIACPSPDDGGIGFGCIDDSQEVIGIQPFQQPVLTTPTDILDGLDEFERLEGRSVLVQVTGLPPVDPTNPDVDFEDIDFNQIEAGYKRVVVSNATTPNNNPEVVGLSADGTELPFGTVLEVDPDQTYAIGAFVSDDTIENYEFLNSDRVIEQRIEEPYITWYATAGTVVEPFTLFPFLESDWRAPEESGTEGTIWGVLRDRRGGQTWFEVPFRVR